MDFYNAVTVLSDDFLILKTTSMEKYDETSNSMLRASGVRFLDV